jgi:hypothetical protein
MKILFLTLHLSVFFCCHNSWKISQDSVLILAWLHDMLKIYDSFLVSLFSKIFCLHCDRLNNEF